MNAAAPPVSEHRPSAAPGSPLRSSRIAAFLQTCKTSEANPEAAANSLRRHELVDAAYNEYCAKREAGEDVDPEAFCDHFPDLKQSLLRLVAAHELLEENPRLLDKLTGDRWPKPGDEFLGFHLTQELGRGAFARVFLATEPALGGRPVAVKISLHGRTEAQTLGRISHPNVVPVYSVKEDPKTGLTAVCMPYLGSATLYNLVELVVNKTPPKDGRAILHAVQDRMKIVNISDAERAASTLESSSFLDAIRTIGIHLAEGLSFIHERNVCHRDLKPSNVLMTPDGRPMILDFNLCADAAVAEGYNGGTLPYMSPEHLLASDNPKAHAARVLDARSDIFSFGVMLYELLTGSLAFGALQPNLETEEMQSLLIQRQQNGHLPIRNLNPHVGKRLAHVVEKCLAYNPKDRYQNAAALAKALRACQSPLRRVSRWTRRHPWLTAAVLLLALTSTGSAAAWWANKEPNHARHWQMGQAAMQEEQYKDAVLHFNAVLDAEPGRIDALQARAKAHLQLGATATHYYSAAAADYMILSKLKPSGEYSAYVGYCRLRQSEDSAAMIFLQDAIKQGYKTAELYNNLAYCTRRVSNNFDEALRIADLSIQMKPTQAAFHNRAMIRFARAINTGSWQPPKAKQPVAANNPPGDAKLLGLLALSKEDLSRALEIGQPNMELCRDAARVWSVSASYHPTDVDAALGHVRAALKLGLDPRLLASDLNLSLLQNTDAFKQLLASSTVIRPIPPTQRISQPILD
jgi:serine/threonine protein kinase